MRGSTPAAHFHESRLKTKDMTNVVRKLWFLRWRFIVIFVTTILLVAFQARQPLPKFGFKCANFGWLFASAPAAVYLVKRKQKGPITLPTWVYQLWLLWRTSVQGCQKNHNPQKLIINDWNVNKLMLIFESKRISFFLFLSPLKRQQDTLLIINDDLHRNCFSYED